MVKTHKLHSWGYKEDIRLCDQSHLKFMYILYCPRQVSMGTHTSRIKNWGWAVIRRKCLIGSIISMQVLTPDAKLAARCTESTHIAASPMLCQGLPESRESCTMLESKPTRCQAFAMFVTCSTWKSCATSEKCCERGYIWTGVCVKLHCRMSWCLKPIRTITVMYISSDLLLIH